MTTTVSDLPPMRPKPGDTGRYVMVSANLLPDEVVAGRRLRALQRNLVIGLAALAVILTATYALCFWQTENARGDLTTEQQRTTALNRQMTEYGPLLSAQADTATITQTLSGLMTDDLSWRTLIDRVSAQSRGDVTVTGVTGATTDPSQESATTTGGGLSLLNDSGKQIVGTITITGTASDNGSLAGFVDRLASVRGITVPLPASVTGTKGELTYTINALVTDDALGGRFGSATGGN